MNKVNTKIPVRFYDDRNWSSERPDAFLKKILFEDQSICLCEIDGFDWVDSNYVLFDKETGDVLTNNLEFWFAENFEE